MTTIDYLAEHPYAVPAVVAWLHSEWGQCVGATSVEEWIPRLQRRLSRGRIPTSFVALRDGVAVGTASLIEHDMSTRPELTPWLAAVYVHPEARRQGIGSALVERAFREAAELGVETLHLFTPDQQRLYARLGWTPRETTRYRNEEVTIMSRAV